MTGRRRYKSAKHSGLAKENKRGGEDQLRKPQKKTEQQIIDQSCCYPINRATNVFVQKPVISEVYRLSSFLLASTPLAKHLCLF
ncbi:hypothetical protein NC651_018720 [Populus alba x Populus x berolinensis]|nr:hypothetical protein NC651_018720 [Populus alba x Populus x berolinensis]